MDEEEWVEYDGGAVQDWHRSARRIRVAPGVAVIPERAFRGCFDLRAVDLGNVTTISDFAFNGCESLERVIWTTAPAVEIGEGAFAWCEKLAEINLSNVTKIGARAFNECQALKRVSILSSVAAIEEGTFAVCMNLTDVELGEGIQRIGRSAFFTCSSLGRINIPASVTDVEASAFNDCSSLVEVVLSEGLEQIGDHAFEDCTSLQSINIPSTASKVGDNAFYDCRQLRHAELQEGVQMIGTGAFGRCHSLERITIPCSVTILGSRAFGNCNNLAEMTLREGIHYIHPGAFLDCPMEHINIPPVALVIDFRGSSCQLLRSTIPVPATLESILVVSKWMQYRSLSQLAQAEAKVNEILGRNDLTAEEKVGRIRNWFAYFDQLDATTMLELAIWRVNMDGNEQDTEARQASRRNCGGDMKIIIIGEEGGEGAGVLQFL